MAQAFRTVIIFAIAAGTFVGLYFAVRAPMRMWRKGDRRGATLMGLAVSCILAVLILGKQAGP